MSTGRARVERSDEVYWQQLATRSEKLSAFLRAGLSPHQAWSIVVGDSETTSVGSFSEHGAVLEVAWRASRGLGVPLAGVLRALAQSCHDMVEVSREIDHAVAGPRLATRIILTLPAVGVLLSSLLGLNVLEFLLMSPMGWACTATGFGLLGLAFVWSRRLINQVSRHPFGFNVSTLLVVSGMRAGVGESATMSTIRDIHKSLGLPPPADIDRDTMRLSQHWGVPVATLLEELAMSEARARRSQITLLAAELGERLLVPLGVCVLPAFLVLSVVPTVMQLVSDSALVAGV